MYIIISLWFPFVSRVVDRCRQCRELDNQARGREDFTLYRAMLKTIRHTEETYKDNSHVIFLLQVHVYTKEEPINAHVYQCTCTCTSTIYSVYTCTCTCIHVILHYHMHNVYCQ